MPSTYTIESIGQKILWENEQNKGDYPAVFQGHEQEVLLFHDSSSDYDPPKVGDEVFGDVVKQRGKFRLKRTSKGKGGGSGGGGGGGRGGGGGSSDKSIERQVAAKAATEMVVALAGITTTSTNPGVMAANFEGFFDTVIAKIQGEAPKPQMEIPADTDGLGERQAVPADDIPFS